MAEAVFRSLTTTTTTPNSQTFTIDSAGTGAYHATSPPDPRTTSTLAAHGITDYTHRARKVRDSDFTEFDYILAMDSENLRNLRRARERVLGRGKDGKEEEEGKGKVMLFGEFGGNGNEEVVDPYFEAGGEGFEVAFEQMVRFSGGFLREVVGATAG